MHRTNLLRLITALSLAVLALPLGNLAQGHELWIEAPAAASAGQAYTAAVCWGHTGNRNTGRMLESQQDKLSVEVIAPDGKRSSVDLKLAEDCFEAKVTPSAPGCYLLGGAVQTGIITKEFHGIPEGARIIMYGKSATQVGDATAGLDATFGHDLELVLLTPPGELKAGGIVKAKLLFQGKPLGGRDVEVSLNTSVPVDDPQVQSTVWSITATPHPKTGEFALPLIVAGRYTFSLRYTDETPGTYQGDMDFVTRISHLHKGDAFKSTLYMTTFAIDVKECE